MDTATGELWFKQEPVGATAQNHPPKELERTLPLDRMMPKR